MPPRCSDWPSPGNARRPGPDGPGLRVTATSGDVDAIQDGDQAPVSFSRRAARASSEASVPSAGAEEDEDEDEDEPDEEDDDPVDSEDDGPPEE